MTSCVLTKLTKIHEAKDVVDMFLYIIQYYRSWSLATVAAGCAKPILSSSWRAWFVADIVMYELVGGPGPMSLVRAGDLC